MVKKMRGLEKKRRDKQQTEEETTQNLNNHPERHMVINDAVNGGVLESRAKIGIVYVAGMTNVWVFVKWRKRQA